MADDVTPVQGVGEGTATPTSSITIEGKEYVVQPELAASFRAQQEQVNTKLTKAQADAQTSQQNYIKLDTDVKNYLEQQKQQAAPQQTAALTQNDEKYWENPTQYVDNMGKNIKQEVTQHVSQTINSNRAAQKFWDQFYEKHGELKGLEDVVNHTLQQNQQSWVSRGLNSDALINELGEFTKRNVQSVMTQYKTNQDLLSDSAMADGVAVFEGGPGITGSRRGQQGGEPVEILSMTDILKKRREKRHAAG